MPKVQEVLPKYLQIAGHIRDQIVRGDLRAGDEVPSERDIAASWDVARPTAARALEVLRGQGLVISRQGSGTYVQQPVAAPRARERYDRARALGGMYGAGESVEFLATELTGGPAHIVEALQLSGNSRLIRRARLLRGPSGRPIELSTSWFDAELAGRAPGLLVPERLVGGTAKYLAEVVGLVAAYARDQVAARLATANERELLELDKPAAALVYQLTIFTADDRTVQCDEAVYGPDQWTLRQEYPLS